MQRLRAMALVGLCVPTVTAGSGCIDYWIASDERRENVRAMSRFDSDCHSMQLVEQLGNQRYKLVGCGHTYVYACKAGHGPRVEWLVGGRWEARSPCYLVQTVRNAPPRRGVASAAGAAAAAATAAATAAAGEPASPLSADEPGAPVPEPRPASQPRPAEVQAADPRPELPDTAAVQAADPRPELPDATAVKQAMASITPAVRRCTTGRLAVNLRVAGSGRVLSADVTTPLDAGSRACVEKTLTLARLSPFRSEAVVLSFLFDLR